MPHNKSLPVRERGLKLYLCPYGVKIVVSLPVRERGLKQFFAREAFRRAEVAPRAGAWIEAA